MRGNIHAILEKELSRRDFLKLVAGLLLATFGIHNIIQYVISKVGTPTTSRPANPTSHGFGSSKFGR